MIKPIITGELIEHLESPAGTILSRGDREQLLELIACFQWLEQVQWVGEQK